MLKKLFRYTESSYCYYYDESHVIIEFINMSKLVELTLAGFTMRLSKIEVLVFDHTDFPESKKVNSRNIDQTRKIARKNNLDLELIKGSDPGD